MFIGEWMNVVAYFIRITPCSRLDCAEDADFSTTPGRLFYRIFAENRYSTIISRHANVDPVIRSRFESAGDMSTKYEECKAYPLCAVLYVPTVKNSDYNFWVEANLIGRSAIRVELVWINVTASERPDDIPLPSALSEKDIRKRKRSGGGKETPTPRHKHFNIKLIAEGHLAGGNTTASHVTVFLKPQLFYTIFDWCVVFITATIALSAGCTTNPRSLVRYVKARPLAIGLGLIIHLFFTPLVRDRERLQFKPT